MFSHQNIKNYILPLAVVFGVSMFSGKIKEYLKSESDNDDYYFVRKYLLNDMPLDGRKKPIIWIYSNYEVNSRKWSSFQGRKNYELNQPYLVECVQSIINHCGESFNICLIDDESFPKLLPHWNVNIGTMMGDEKQKYIQLGILKLIYTYGGINIPNSFLCTSNLDNIFKYSAYDGIPFFFEKINRSTTTLMGKNDNLFVPGLQFYGCHKENETIRNIIEFYEDEIISKHNSSAHEFEGYISNYLSMLYTNDSILVLGGSIIGIKTHNHKPLLIEDLLSESQLPLSNNTMGILIPRDEILKRTKYNWFSVMSMEEIYKSKLLIADYFVDVKEDNLKLDLSRVTQI